MPRLPVTDTQLRTRLDLHDGLRLARGQAGAAGGGSDDRRLQRTAERVLDGELRPDLPGPVLDGLLGPAGPSRQAPAPPPGDEPQLPGGLA